MSMTKTATVEVLTAEVRVLMVGSRQVTLSVYRQLDCVPVGDIEPFGRVNDGDHLLSIVGLARSDSSLAKSTIRRTDAVRLSQNLKVLGEISDREMFELQTFFRWSALPLIVLAGLR